MYNHEFNYKEIFVAVPWGKIALLTWGDPSSEPVLLVHGRQDSAATFIPLVGLLPKSFYYVAVDLPGNGRSDPFPKGLVLSRYHYVHTIDVIVKHLRWKSFIFIGHSMGCEIGLFYNAATPGVISKAVLLDTGPTFQRLDQPDHVYYYKECYHRYYSNYDRYNGPNKLYTKREALEALMTARGVSEADAQLLLSRNLVADGDRYRLSWDSRSKWTAPQNLSKEHYLTLFTSNAPPILFICMTDGQAGYTRGVELANYLIENMLRTTAARRVILEGGHDHHVTHPTDIRPHVENFLNQSKFSSKL